MRIEMEGAGCTGEANGVRTEGNLPKHKPLQREKYQLALVALVGVSPRGNLR
jgi:hypothetical protein